MRAYSDDLRLRIHEARQSGEATAEVAERFGVSTAFVRRLEQRFRSTGSLAPRRGGGGRAAALAGRDEVLRRAVREHPDATPAFSPRPPEADCVPRHRLAGPATPAADPPEEIDARRRAGSPRRGGGAA